ncbi:MAG: restriction endonuclease subunit M, partial [Flexilinea flocculi]|nr:restriction endonuclease subunit M [Flexilinea flocculi]
MVKQVKTKQRVTDHGEVFTAEREVNAMLDLVKQETERIDSRFLEPACGDGNFLAEILRRKLAVVKKKYRKSPMDYEKNAVLAATSIYGIDILQDNVDACRERMFEIWDKEYRSVLKKEVNEDCREAVRFIFSRNIICGNALSLKKVDANGNDINEPIVFSEWAFVTGANLQRKDYTLDKLLQGPEQGKDIFNRGKPPKARNAVQQSLFAE